MIAQNEGKIFLAGERSHEETDWFRSYNTFNVGTYQQAHKHSFGPLYRVTETTLAGTRSLIRFAAEDTVLVLIPTVGAIRFCDSLGNTTTIEAGQVQIHDVYKGMRFEISNPYAHELINFIELSLKKPLDDNLVKPQLVSIDLEQHKNKLVLVYPAAPDDIKGKHNFFKTSLGKFDGRNEVVYQLAHPHNGLFLFVIEGAFEVQNRLLEAGDGLALWHLKEAEIEALSNNAAILLVEMQLSESKSS